MDERSGGRAADGSGMNIVLVGGGGADEDDLVLEKSAVAVVVLPVSGHKNFVKRVGLVRVVGPEPDHPEATRRRDAIAGPKFSERPRVERFVASLPGSSRDGIEAVHQPVDL